MNTFFEYINGIVQLSDDEIKELLCHLKPVTLEKGAVFIDYGNICSKIAFVQHGLLEMNFMDENAEKIVDFFFSNSFATDYKSFLSAKPSEVQIKTLKKTDLLILEKHTLENLYDKNIKYQKIGRILVEKFYLELAERIRMQTLSPKIRYHKLCLEYPEIRKEIPQYKIASYLGVSAEWLSKLRSKK